MPDVLVINAVPGLTIAKTSAISLAFSSESSVIASTTQRTFAASAGSVLVNSPTVRPSGNAPVSCP